MPLCVNCAFPSQSLYTTYKSQSNIRLSVCPRCDKFFDPLIEHPKLILLLDLILLKPRVYLHLLYNRGSKPFKADDEHGITATIIGDNSNVERSSSRENHRRSVQNDILILGICTFLAETAVRYQSQTNSNEFNDPLLIQEGLLKIIVLVLVELATQHLTTLILALGILKLKGWYPYTPQTTETSSNTKTNNSRDGRQEYFLPALINLTLLYTSLIPLLLHLFLGIWSSPSSTSYHPLSPISTPPFPATLTAGLPTNLQQPLQQIWGTVQQTWQNTDKIWIGTRLLGGMSSGFGLRVLLPTRPAETTFIVLSGWVMGALAVWVLREVGS